MLILVIALILFAFWFVYFHVSKFRLYRLSWNVPGPSVLPFIGSLHLFIGNSKELGQKLFDLFTTYPDFAKIWLGKDLTYLVTKPEHVEAILNSPHALEKMEAYDYTSVLIGKGLLTGPVNLWKKHRKVIAPFLNQKKLNSYQDIISEQCDILVQILQKFAGQEIDHCEYITNCTIDILAETFFDASLHAQQSEIPYSYLFDNIMEIIFYRAFHAFYRFDIIFSQTTLCKKLINQVNVIKNITSALIDCKIKEMQSVPEPLHNKDSQPFLNLMVDKYLLNEWSRAEVEDEVNTFLLAGSDTNATTASFVLTMLSMHPNIQQNVHEEILEVLADKNIIKFCDLANLKQLDRVIKETLRLFPGAPFSGRTFSNDVHLGDFILPKNSSAIISYFNLHRSEKYWTNPLAFDPDRFLPEGCISRHPYTWIPFSAGPRNCIGFKYGMLTTKIIVAKILRQFKVDSDIKKIEDIKLFSNIVLKPKNGFRLKLFQR